MTIATAQGSYPNLTQCPVCDSPGLTRAVTKGLVTDPFGGQVEFDKVYYSCAQCGAEGDWNTENESRTQVALEKLRKMAVAKIADMLKDEYGISNLQLERSFGLPMRTVARWKKDGASAAATALMKCVATFPWLTDLGSRHFNGTYAHELLVKYASNVKFNDRTPMRLSAVEANGKKITDEPTAVAANEALSLAA